MKFAILFDVLTLLLLCGCEKKSISGGPSSKGVTLIFRHAPENSRYTFLNGISTNNGDIEIQYLDDRLLTKFIAPDSNSIDTIRINSERNLIEIDHSYRGADKLSIILTNGDTALFNYAGKRPDITITNRNVSKTESNYEILMRDIVYKGDFPTMIKHKVPFAFIEKNSKTNRVDYKTKQEEFKIQSFQDLANEKQLLDSLNKSRIMSQSIVDLYILQNKYDSIRFALQFDNSHLFPQKYLTHDSLLYYGFYNDFLDAIVFDYYSAKVAKVKNKGSINPDFTAIYDSIKSSNLYSQKTKLVLLEKALNAIFLDQPIEIMKRYFDDFKKADIDSIHTTYLQNKYRLNFSHSDSLKLIDLGGESITYDELLSKNAGNLVYIDFWASWCAPCIQQFQNSKTLKENFNGQHVSFIYISIDTDSIKWRKASRKYNLTNSYLVDNRYSSKLTDELEVSTIPRYFLYNKSGEIVHENAPRPDSKEIAKLLKKYLLE